MPELSIVIVNWNVKEPIAECLSSLATIEAPKIEVIVVDNASTDGSIQMLQKKFPWVKLIANQDNKGFAKACNQGIKISEGDYILLLNPDTVVPEGALEPLLSFAKDHPEAGVIGPKILNTDGSVQQSVRSFPSFWNQTVIQLKLHRIFRNSKIIQEYRMANFPYDSVQSVDQVMGAAFLIPKTVIEKIGALDERYFVWFEEVDFCLTVKRAGLDVLFCPNTNIIHKQGQSFFQLVSTNRQRMMNDSMRKYFFKNHGFLHGAWFTALHPISIGLAYLVQWFKVKPKAL